MKFGWIPDTPDHRDRKYGVSQPLSLPKELDLRKTVTFPEIWNQGHFNSCVWHAIPAAVEVARQYAKQSIFMPSRMFGYYNTRKMENSEDSDPGCMIRNAIKSLAVDGCISESAWPYEEEYLFRQPPQMAYDLASKYQLLEYSRVNQDEASVKSALVDGFPIIFGFSVYENIAKVKDTLLPPQGSCIGGHAVLCIGYDKDYFLIRNSWGEDWGDKGYFKMPYDYLLNPDLSDDLWIARLLE